MIPLQEIDIHTKNKGLFKVHLIKWETAKFNCELAAVKFHKDSSGDAVFGPFTEGTTAQEAFKNLLEKFEESLCAMANNDEIESLDNPCNCEFVSKQEQESICQNRFTIKVNGE